MSKNNLNYEGENRSLHMKERIGYGTGDFANNMMYSTVNSFYTYFLTNVVGLGAGIAGTILLVSRLMDGSATLSWAVRWKRSTANTAKQDRGFCGGVSLSPFPWSSCSPHRTSVRPAKSSTRFSPITWQLPSSKQRSIFRSDPLQLL